MEKRKIGNSDVVSSILAMGAWAIGGGSWWGENDDDVSVKAIHKAVDCGITWIDTAPAYGCGHSEKVVGKALKGIRNDVIVSTKCGLQWYDENGSFFFSRDGKNIYRDLAPKAIRRDLEESLKRLDTDYIDVYYTHWQSVEPGFVPIEETMYELMKMKKEGKIRVIGASNVTTQNIEEYIKYGQLDVIQEKFSILDRRIEKELLPMCEEKNITLQTYSPIEQGLLTGKIKADYKVEPNNVRDGKKWWLPENVKIAVELLDTWSDLTEKYNCTMGNLVIKWTSMRSDKINVLCGARKVEQIEENVKAAEINLSKEDFDRMNKQSLEAISKSVELV